MEVYNYTARDANGRVLKSHCQAASEAALRSQLKAMGYTVNSIAPRTTSQISGQRKRIKLQDIVNMCRRFSVMYGAGLGMMDCLSALVRENESRKLSDDLQDIHNKIAGGSGVAEAFSKHTKVFSRLFVNMLRAGETAGKFDYVLRQLTTYLEKEYDLKRKIRQSFAYPLTVVVMVFLVVTVIMIVVVPVFSKVYVELGIPLPGPTVALISISNNAVYIFPSIIVLAAGLWALHKKLRAIPAVKDRLDRVKLSMFLVGAIYHKIVLLKFVRTLSTMVTAGIQLSDAVAVAEDVADNTVVSEATNMIQSNIKRGGTITEAVRLHGFFPQTIVHAFSAGEEAGQLGGILGKFADGIEQDVDDGMKRLVTKIEPMLIVVLSLIIGFILLAIYLPIFDLMKALRA